MMSRALSDPSIGRRDGVGRLPGSVLTALGLFMGALVWLLVPVEEVRAAGCATPDAPPRPGSAYEISTTGHLEWLRAGNVTTSRLSEAYVLTADLDLSGCVWTEGIGDTSAFTGTFHGNGHRIDHLTVANVQASGTVRAGLFASATHPASITDLAVSGTVSATSTSTAVASLGVHAGGVIGDAHTASLSDLHFAGRVVADISASDATCAAGTCGHEVLAGGVAAESSGSVSSLRTSDVSISAVGGDDVFVGGVFGRRGSVSVLDTVEVERVDLYSSGRAFARAGGVAGVAYSAQIRNISVEEASVQARVDRAMPAAAFRVAYAGGVIGDHVDIAATGPTTAVRVSGSQIRAVTDQPFASPGVSRAFAGGVTGDSDVGFRDVRVTDTDVLADARQWAHAGGVTGWLWSDDTVEDTVVAATVTARVPTTDVAAGNRAVAGGIGGYDEPKTLGQAPRVHRSLRVDAQVAAQTTTSGSHQGDAESGGVMGVAQDVAPADVSVTGTVDALATGSQATAYSGGLASRAWNFEPRRGLIASAITATATSTSAQDPVLGRRDPLGGVTVSPDVFWHGASTAPATTGTLGSGISTAQMVDAGTFSTFSLTEGWRAAGVFQWGRCTWDSSPVPFLLLEYSSNPCTNPAPVVAPPPPPTTTTLVDTETDTDSPTSPSTSVVVTTTTDRPASTVPTTVTAQEPWVSTGETLPATGTRPWGLGVALMVLGCGTVLVARRCRGWV